MTKTFMCLNIIAFAEYFCRTYMHQEVTRLIQFTPHFVIASSLIIGVLVQCVTNIGRELLLTFILKCVTILL